MSFIKWIKKAREDILDKIIFTKSFINELRGLSIAVGLIGGIVLIGVIVSLVVDEFASALPTQDVTSVSWNVSQYGLKTFQNLFKQMPILGTLLVLLVIAAIALGIFAFFGGGSSRGNF